MVPYRTTNRCGEFTLGPFVLFEATRGRKPATMPGADGLTEPLSGRRPTQGI